MFWLFVIAVLVYYGYKRANRQPDPPATIDFSRYDKEWIVFIKSYANVAKSKSEKALIMRMLEDLQKQGYQAEDPSVWVMDDGSTSQVAEVSTQYSTSTKESYEDAVQPLPQKSKAQIQLDNASLLLYFGAFLLVASAGLFVAFAGLNGTIRTFVVLLVAFVMYAGGMTIHEKRPRFKQAGLTFVGIGMAIAPLVGLAAYSYIFDKQNGAAVWLATSLLCLGMYAHALVKLRNPLLNYLFIFTFVSLFESSVAIVDLPLYYFGWALAGIGLLLTFVARYKGIWDDMRESSNNSSMIFLPIALVSSLILIGEHGATQFGVSLLLASVYYALQAYDTIDEERQSNAIVSHVSLLLALSTISFGISKNWTTTGLVLAVLNTVQLAYVLSVSTANILVQNFASVLVVSSVAATLLSLQSKTATLIMVAATTVITALISYKQKRSELYVLAATSLLVLPLVYSQYFASPVLAASQTILLLLGAALIQLLVLIFGKKLYEYVMDGTAQYTYLATACVVVGASFFASPAIVFGVSAVMTVSFVLLGRFYDSHDWEGSAGLIICAPLLLVLTTTDMLLVSVLTALAVNILVALKSRSEINRWVSTALWLALPVAFGMQYNWNPVAYSWSYFVAMLGLVFSRAIARGVVFVSGKVPLAAYATNSSYSYEYGYWFAAAISVAVSLTTDASRLHTSLLLSALVFVVLLLSRTVEKRSDLLTLVPLLMQGVLLSALRPISSSQTELYLYASTVLAISSYLAGIGSITTKKDAQYAVKIGALAAVCITPISYMFIGETLFAMPVGLLAGSLLFAYHYRNGEQSVKEIAWSGVAATVAWVFYFAGIIEPQAYVHIVVALFACYAYWRHILGQVEQCDQYLYAMLITATVPLTLQAIGSEAGGLYGWWLLLEQIGFIVLGMSIGKKFITKWGLYTAVAAVLYQLRDLGWAALTVLAVFLISLAVYKIQKNVDK